MMQRIGGVILAGGQGRRMGGARKGLLTLSGRPLIAHAAARLGPQVTALALSANGPAAAYAEFGLPVLPDETADFPGPLAGVLSGLRWAEAQGLEAIVTVPCDAPFLPRDLAARLAAAGPFAMAALKGRAEPAFALWPVTRRAEVEAALAAGRRKVTEAAGGAALVDFPDAGAFFNINTPEALAEAEARLAGAGEGPDQAKLP